MDDQTFSGFVLFAVVKITLFVAFSFIFLSAFAESAEGDGGDDGGRERRQPPALPGWVLGLLRGGPTVEEPAAEPAAAEPTAAQRREPVGASRRR
jgi:hypothetical protein